mmetsp:Transcript_9437/g.14148  ORF Transcript_9437/g.14148 Transcript_9437/m.14148 type:complete len:318 (-) Transcript_9437:123-1076(-)
MLLRNSRRAWKLLAVSTGAAAVIGLATGKAEGWFFWKKSSVAPKKFYIFGHPVSKSPSPLMHNTGFKTCGLPHVYTAEDTTDVQRVEALVKSPEFGGASVTIPLKEKLFHLVDEKSESVQAIGALNTLIPKDGKILADNTDWKGIIYPLSTHLDEKTISTSKSIVVGAGGTARAAIFALTKMGFSPENVIVINPRTPSKAEALANEFKCSFATDISSMTKVAVVLSTVPSKAKYVPPKTVLDQHPIVFEASYLPARTTLGEASEKAGCTLVKGLDMLIAQGVEQFELWTGESKEKVRPSIDSATREMYYNTYIKPKD